MAKSTLEELQEQERIVREQVNEYEQATEVARGIAELQRKKAALQLEVNKYLTQDRPDAGTIKRMTAVLGSLSGVNAIYQANEAAIQKAAEDANAAPMEFLKTFTKQYAKDVGKNLMTAATGKDYTVGNKTYKDIITKQMGGPDNAVTTVAGVIGDITIDANIVGGLKPIFSAVQHLGKAGVGLASKIPQIDRGIEALQKNFNIFYEIEKLHPAADVQRFKDAFRTAVATKDFSVFADLGLDVSKLTPQVPGQIKNLTDMPGSVLGAFANKYRSTTGQFASPKAFEDVIDTAFLKPGAEGIFEKSLDVTNRFFKGLLSWSPKFQTRNFMGALTQNIGEGVGVGSYWDALKLLTRGKGTELYGDLQKTGVLSQPGMFEQVATKGEGLWQNIKNIPANIATWGESLHRTAMILKETAEGAPLLKAVEKTEKVFYKYGSEYLTPFQENLSKIFPFLKFQIGQAGYFPGKLNTRGGQVYYNALGEMKEATAPEDVKKYPALTAEWFKDMLTVGSVGNVGFQIEDFLRNITGDVKNIWGQVAPLLKTATEGVVNYKVFSDKKMSTDTEGKKYEHAGSLIQGILGYDDATKTVGPIRKWIAETWTGPLLDAWTTAMDPKKGPLRAIFSIREYDTGLIPSLQQQEMNRREKGKDKWGWGISDMLGFGPQDVGAAEIPQDALAKYRADLIASFDKETAKKNLPSGLYDTKLVRSGAPGEQRMDFDIRARMMDDVVKALTTAGPDVGKNIAASHGAALEAMMKKADFYGFTNHPDFKKLLDATKASQQFLTPRAIGGKAAFSPEDLKYRKMPTGNAAMDYNKAAEEVAGFTSKTAEFWRASFVKSEEAVRRGLDAAEKAALIQYKTSYGMISEDNLNDRIRALRAEAAHAIDDLKAKSLTAVGNIIENLADSEVEGIKKIDLQHQAALKKYQGSEEYRRALAAKNAEEINLAVAAIDAKYAEKRRNRLAEEAKAHAEAVSNMLKDQGSAIVAALEDAYKRGGMSIEEFYSKKMQQATSQFIRTTLTDITTFQSQMKEPGFAENTKFTLGKMEGQMPSKENIDAMTSQIQAVIYASKSMDELVTKLKELGIYVKAEQQGIVIDIASAATKRIEEFKKTYEKFDEFRTVLINLLSDPTTKPDKVITILKEIADAMSKALQTGDYKELAASWKKMNDNATGIEKIIPDIQKDAYEATKKFREATLQIKKESADMLRQAYANLPTTTLGVTSYPATGGTRYGTIRTPMYPQGYDPIEDKKKADLAAHDRAMAQKFSGADIGAEFKLPMMGEEEDPVEYINRSVDSIIAKRKELTDALEESYNDEVGLSEERELSLEASVSRIDAMLQRSIDANIERNIIIAKSDADAAQKRIQVYTEMASALNQTFTMLYEAGGKKSREMFYMMKAAAVAEAIMKGALAILSAKAAGASIGGPAALATAALYGSIMTAMVGVQIGMILASAIKGPEGKKEGGRIEGGSGVRDDVPILAMGGEYVIKKKAVKQYGIAFMDALNKGQIELARDVNIPENIISSLTNISKKTTYAEGGLVVPEREPKETLIVLENKTGTQMKMTDNGTKFDGKKMVRSIIFDLVDTDPTFVNMMRGSGK